MADVGVDTRNGAATVRELVWALYPNIFVTVPDGLTTAEQNRARQQADALVLGFTEHKRISDTAPVADF